MSKSQMDGKSSMGYLESLEPILLEERADIELIDRWLKVLNWPNGWHYDLDIIWTLRQLRQRNIGRGATILDAGAGLGITQFLLASLGYNVVSLDFTLRKIPEFTKGIFKIVSQQESYGDGDHEYMRFMTYGQKAAPASRSLLDMAGRAVSHPGRAAHVLRQALKNRLNVSYLLEKSRDHSDFGTITFLRGSFNAIPLPDESVDALVSISAFEHNSYKDMPVAAREFQRVVKKGGPVLVTTSLAKDKDWYFEPSKGWNLTASSLASWFAVDDVSRCAFDRSMEAIRGSAPFRNRINGFYRHDGNNGLPFGRVEDAKYVPVAVCKPRASLSPVTAP